MGQDVDADVIAVRVPAHAAVVDIELHAVALEPRAAALAHLVWSSAKRHGILTAVFAAPEWKIVSLQNTDRAASDAS